MWSTYQTVRVYSYWASVSAANTGLWWCGDTWKSVPQPFPSNTMYSNVSGNASSNASVAADARCGLPFGIHILHFCFISFNVSTWRNFHWQIPIVCMLKCFEIWLTWADNFLKLDRLCKIHVWCKYLPSLVLSKRDRTLTGREEIIVVIFPWSHARHQSRRPSLIE